MKDNLPSSPVPSSSPAAELPWAWIGGSFVVGILAGALGMGVIGGGNGSASADGVAGARSGSSTGTDSSGMISSRSAIGEGATNMDGSTTPAAAELQAAFNPEPQMVMDKLLASLTSGEDMEGLSVLARIQQLKDMGDPGLQVISDYLASYEDIEFGDEMGRMGRRFPNLRSMLIDSLRGVNSPIAQAANLKVLETSPFLSETAAAARNLEESWPGEHREASIKSIAGLLDQYNSDLASNPANTDNFAQLREYFPAMRFITDNNAVELLPKMESAIATSGQGAGHYVMQLGSMGADTQADALSRMASDPTMRTQLADSGWALSRLDYNDPKITETTVGIFTADMNADQQKQLVESLARVGGRDRRWGGNNMSDEERASRTTGAISLLQTLQQSGALQGDVQAAAQNSLDQLSRRGEG